MTRLAHPCPARPRHRPALPRTTRARGASPRHLALRSQPPALPRLARTPRHAPLALHLAEALDAHPERLAELIAHARIDGPRRRAVGVDAPRAAPGKIEAAEGRHCSVLLFS